jgi:hypothetical protein
MQGAGQERIEMTVTLLHDEYTCVPHWIGVEMSFEA